MSNKLKIRGFLSLLIFIFLLGPITYADENAETLSIVPGQIQIGTFYHGSSIEVTAEVDSCDNAVIVLEGGEKEVTLNRKGRVAIIWMNVAQLEIENMPQVYIMASSADLNDICPAETQMELKLGLESLRPQMKIISEKPLTGEEFDQFLKLKTKNGTYDTKNKIELTSESSGITKVSASLPIPSQMPPGEYIVNLYYFKHGELIGERAGLLGIKRVGLPELMINLATEHAAVYGLMAIVIAMVVGIVMGFIFSSLPGKEH
jgi:uncharacterized protein (TIGR02186 family)